MIGYVTFSNGTTTNYNTFNDAIVAAQSDPGAVFYVTDTVNGQSYCTGVTTVFYRGATGNLYGGGQNGAVDSANITLLGGSFASTIVGGGGPGTDVNGNVSIVIDGFSVIGSAASNRHVSGVGSGTVHGDVNIDINSGTVFGYVRGVSGGAGATAYGRVNITVQGGVVASNLQGAGLGNALGGVLITIFRGLVNYSVTGGGTGSSTVEGPVRIDVVGGTVGVSVFGVGQGSATGPVILRVLGGEITRNIYGIGGGTLNGKVNIHISGGVIFGDVFATGSSHYNGAPEVKMSDGVVLGDLYGGGENAACDGLSVVNITGGNFAGSSRVFGGSSLVFSNTYSQDAQVTLDSGGSTLLQLAGGFNIHGNGGYTLGGDTSVTLSAGTVTYGITGRTSVTGNATVNDTNIGAGSRINLSGGYSRIVAGAGMIGNSGAHYNYTGNTEINLSGGTVDYLFGGNAAYRKSCCGNTAMYGDVAINVDTSGANEVTLQYLFAGSNSNGGSQAIQEGNTVVTFRGDGANLAWASNGGLSGDGAAKYSDIDNTRFNRSLVFDGFTGSFDAPAITRFDSMRFLNGSDVAFSSATLKLGGVAAWEFAFGASLYWSDGSNNFADDDLVFGSAGDTLASGVVWEAITSDNNQLFRGWDRLGSIEVFGDVLDTYDANTLTWTSANSGWVAGWNDSSKCIYIAQSV